MLTGFLIRLTHCLTKRGWHLLSRLSSETSSDGQNMQKVKAPSCVPPQYVASPNGSMRAYMSEGHWLSDTATVQVIERQGFPDLYIAGAKGKSATFYDANDMAMWLFDQGIDIEDPIWDYIELLPTN
jgi:hypothetical protein